LGVQHRRLQRQAEELRDSLAREVDRSSQLQAIFDLQHSRTTKADQLWREAHPDSNIDIPDLGKLIDWLIFRYDMAEARCQTASNNARFYADRCSELEQRLEYEP